MNRSFN